jgi:FtsH-binding integral membrane protein
MQPLPHREVWKRLRPPPGAGPFTQAAEFQKGEKAMLGTILIVFLILALIGAVPRWSHSRDWGYFPTGGVGLVLAVVVVLVLLGRL